jgi:hypothetical protein
LTFLDLSFDCHDTDIRDKYGHWISSYTAVVAKRLVTRIEREVHVDVGPQNDRVTNLQKRTSGFPCADFLGIVKRMLSFAILKHKIPRLDPICTLLLLIETMLFCS